MFEFLIADEVEFSLSWLDRYAGTGRDSVRANTRREYRRLLVNFHADLR